MNRTPPRGFVYYDIWILAVVVGLVAAVIVPSVLRAVRKEKVRRAERADLLVIATLEQIHHDRYHAYADSLPLVLTSGIQLVALRADSTGWSAVVTNDSLQRTRATCGVFEGPATFAPDSAVTVSGQIACW